MVQMSMSGASAAPTPPNIDGEGLVEIGGSLNIERGLASGPPAAATFPNSTRLIRPMMLCHASSADTELFDSPSD